VGFVAAYEKLKSGKHSYVVRLPNGKRRRFTDVMKRVARQQADDFEASLRRGAAVPDQKLTVDAWAAKWFTARRVEPNTAAKNDSHWRNHIQPHWGSWPITSIDRLDVQTWVNDLEKRGVGASTVHAAYNLLSKLLADAVLSKKLHASPCVEITLPTVVPPAERWLTAHEYDRIQLALANRVLRIPRTDRSRPDPLAPMWQALVALGCYSGLRCPGELTGLDVEHLDFDRNLVRVQQVLTRHGMKAYPKTGPGSERWVPFPPEVARLLWRWVADRGSGPVFVGARGARVTEIAIRRVWRAALEEAGVEYVDPYSMRHTCASWLTEDGVPDRKIAQILGHSSTRMLGVYAHLDPKQHDDVRAAWEKRAATVDPQVPHGGNEKSPSPSGLGL
jgi:integrase